MLARLSRRWARVEIFCAAGFAVAITLLILLNVVTRAFNASIYWVDEAAIYAMVWMAFLAASAAVHERSSVSVTLIRDMLGPTAHRWLGTLIDLTVVVFAFALLYFLWRWLAPLELLRAGFDLETFQSQTFNFIYAEPTTTLGVRKIWIWLIMPIFAFGVTLHAVANLFSPQSSDWEDTRP
ncbi:TRAP transporter small permease [Sulfitobacter sp. S190]|uniref:TRAP transporter small permease n=1 Tax=Sulfitobacter sp. S190 TaxID=2867022 RepID=UPI0021A2D041|nr:TRAP transporter small permease [Sulfitobacter sp. S190]UWR23044.1 TRAP transporter small permease [Sulfitobacter sp. S190]